MESLNPNMVMDYAVNQYVATVRNKSNILSSSENISYKQFLSNKMLIIQAIRSGIPYEFYELIKEKSPFNQEDWANFLGISSRTLLRNKQTSNFVFDAIPSEKIIELAEVTALGSEVFDEESQFQMWLQSPNFALGNHKPFDLLKDSYGKEMVMNELHKIDQGIFA